MKESIPFVKEVVFKDRIYAITSISLEHQEKINEGEISGEFIIFGDYKIHADTTEKEMFKYRLPYTTIIPNNIEPTTVKVDIEDFTYDIIDDQTMKVNIDYSIEGEEKAKIEEVTEDRIIPENIPEIIPDFIIPSEEKEEQKEEIIEESKEEKTENNKEFITYYIHIVKENDSLEEIIKKYETTIDNIKMYNNISNINIGDKLIIPKTNE